MFLYFFSASGRIKIGVSHNVERRLTEIGLHLDERPKLLRAVRGTEKLEKRVHAMLAAHRISGEWFVDNSSVREVMELVLNMRSAFADTEIEQVPEVPGRERDPIFGKICKVIWPTKTAAQLASRVGCSERTSAYELSGEREPSARSILVIMEVISPKRK